MENIRRKIKIFLSKYNNLFLKVVGGFIAFIFILRMLDNYAAIKYENNLKKKENIKIQQQEEKEKEKYKEIVENFITYCIYGCYEDAYNMLSTECKQNNFTTKQDFIENFINKKIDINKEHIIEEIEDCTYLVKTRENLLETGGVEIATKVMKCKVIYENEIKKITIFEEVT